jgi:hypothetical protein
MAPSLSNRALFSMADPRAASTDEGNKQLIMQGYEYKNKKFTRVCFENVLV